MRNNSLDIDTIITKLVRDLSLQQEKDGSYSSTINGETVNDTVFYTSLILIAINELEDKKQASVLIRKATAFLSTEKSDFHTWNYWKKKSKNRKEKPYPDDLDDTFCALSALYFHQPKYITGDVLADVASTLIHNESQEGGPYQTWIVRKKDKKKWEDADIVVNANIAYFLAQEGIILPKVEAYITKELFKKRPASEYYHSLLSICYFTCRISKDDTSKRITEIVLSERVASGLWKNPLETALAVCALIRTTGVTPQVKDGIDFLIEFLQKEIPDAYPFFIEERKGKEISYSGSKAFTSAVIVEALSLYKKALITYSSPVSEVETKLISGIDKLVQDRYLGITSRMQERVKGYSDAITVKDPSNQISLLPYYTWLALGSPEKVSARLLRDAGAANLLGWIAYRIYDDILDDEGGISDLPVANIALREVSELYRIHLPSSEWKVFESVLDVIEKANSWESEYCNVGSYENALLMKVFPDYDDYNVLAEKSFGHALTSFSVFVTAGYSGNSKETKNILSFFKHYIIARQLNDDAHDWLSDLERGFLNSVNVQILTEWKKKRMKKIGKEKEQLQIIFWNTVIAKIAEDVFRHIALARKSLKANRHICDPTYFESLLVPIENATNKAIYERKRMLDFLKKYK